MKKLLSGSESIAYGLYEAGVKHFFTSSTSRLKEAVENFPKTQFCSVDIEAKAEIDIKLVQDEKESLEAAVNSAKNGLRSFCELKMTDSDIVAELVDFVADLKISAGMVICVTDDPNVQFEVDSRTFALSAGLPLLEPSNSDECRSYIALAYRLSEKFAVPVIVRLTPRISRTASVVEIGEGSADEGKLDLCMDFADFAEKASLNNIEDNESAVGIITAGGCLNHAKEAFGQNASYLKLGMLNPMPTQLINDFASHYETVIVLEEIAPVIENHCMSNGLQVIGRDVLCMFGECSEETLREMLFGIEPDYCEIGAIIPERL